MGKNQENSNLKSYHTQKNKTDSNNMAYLTFDDLKDYTDYDIYVTAT